LIFLIRGAAKPLSKDPRFLEFDFEHHRKLSDYYIAASIGKDSQVFFF
jgi:hypothetical protein